MHQRLHRLNRTTNATHEQRPTQETRSRFVERCNPAIVRYLEFAREFNEKFPGFETDIHGLMKDASNGAVRYDVDCVRQ
ncbi:MAG: hypothetical protein K9J42_00425 [Sulfuritalea sp.]|nr:hypothetical protein [Sulfuritalea sp.]